MNKVLVRILPATVFLFPFIVSAQNPNLGWFESLVSEGQSIVDLLPRLFIGLALVALLYGVARYIFAAGNEDAQKQGKSVMIGGIIALFVAVSIWGIVSWVQGITGIDSESTTVIPGVPTN